MPSSLTDLLAGVTPAGAKQLAVNLLAGAGFPTSAWQSGTVGRTFVEGEAQIYSDLASLIATMAASGLLSYAAGPWLDLLASNVYQLTRKPALPTQGLITLTDGGGGPTTLSNGQVWVADASGAYLYQASNVYSATGALLGPAGGVLPLNGTLTLGVQAAAPASAYNTGVGAITRLVTSLPGVVVSNPDDGLGQGTWITQWGADAETDASLALRCRARWPALGSGGGTALAYQGWALGASSEITRVVVFPGNPVNLFLAGASGPVSGAAVTAANNAIVPLMPVGIGLTVFSTTLATQALTGSYTVKAAAAANAAAKIQTNVNALFASIPIGGTLYLSQLIEAFMTADPGMIDVSLTSPAATYSLSSTQVFGPPPGGLAGMTVVKV